MIRASVIIPTYHRETSILDALESLIHQDIDDYEIIVIDNAVSSSLENRIALFSKKNMKAIRYCAEPKLGLHFARNKALELSNHSQIQILEQLVEKYILSGYPNHPNG